MNKIKKFGNFLNESAIYEDKQWYIDNGYVTDPSITNKEDLFDDINSKISAAWDDFIYANNIPAKGSKINIDEIRGASYISLVTDAFSEDLLGPIFSKVLKKCSFVFFSGRKIQYAKQDDEFMFVPTIWTNINISYESNTGGTNGMDYPIVDVYEGRKSNDVYYNIMEGKFYNFIEMRDNEKK